MGKRRTNAPHRDRYAGNDSESEEEEEYTEPEPLQPEQIASIKTRKKLIAKRRGGATSDTAGVGVFGALSRGTNNSEDTDKPAASVFSGFKGFSAFKPSEEPPKAPITTTTSSIFAATSTATPNTTSAFSFTAQVTTTKPTNGETTAASARFVKDNKLAESTNTTKALDSEAAQSTTTPDDNSSNNITETEINFINELNYVYEKYYGKTKRVLKLPAEVVGTGQEENSGENRKKYGLLLSELNKHCAKWINKHVEEDPLIVMTPIFVDYFNYLILMEKSFFPLTNMLKSANTTSFANMNGTATAGSGISSTVLKVTNGDSHSTTNIISNNSKSEANGHKDEMATQKLNGFDSMADKENEEAEKDKKLSDSSKSFASLIGKTPIAPISFAASASNSGVAAPVTPFSFKPMETTKLVEKDANSSTPTTQSSLFKFGATSSTETSNKSLSGVTTSETVFGRSPASSEEPKLNFKSPAASQLSSIAPTFKFGSSVTASEAPKSSPTETTTSSLFSKPVDSVSSIFGNKPADSSASLFGKTATDSATTPSLLFGSSKPSETKSDSVSLFSKPTESTTSTTAKGSSIFSGLNNLDSSAKDPEEKQPTTNAPTFSSLMSNSKTTGGGFKGFAGFGGSSTTTSFGSAAAETNKPLFSFGGTTEPGAQPGGLFGAGTTGTSLFGTGSTFPGVVASGEGNEQEQEEEYVPPKPETSDVKEEGAVFEKRMKLYYYSEKESKFVDRGIGNLYLKPINDGEATQLIIRADNKLASILLNVKLNKAFPVSKISAKDVSYLCIPNPPIPNVDSKLPCKFLFKVKTEDDAVELVEKLNEYKR